MARTWEIRGLFGNEFTMEQAVEELKNHKGFELTALDRRNLSVRFAKRDAEAEGSVKRAIEMYHGYVQHEGPLGQYDRAKMKEQDRSRRMDKEKRKRREKQ